MKSIKWTLAVLSGLLLQIPGQAGLFKTIAKESIAETAKSTMVTIVNDTRPDFKKGMSENAFIDAVLVDIPKEKRSAQVTNYFKKVFYYHQRGLSDQDIRAQEKGETLIALADRASDSSLNGAFFNDVNDPLVSDFNPKKWWIKILIQILMTLLSNL